MSIPPRVQADGPSLSFSFPSGLSDCVQSTEETCQEDQIETHGSRRLNPFHYPILYGNYCNAGYFSLRLADF